MASQLIRITTGQLIKDFDLYKVHFLHFVMKDRSTFLLIPVAREEKKLITKDTKQHTIIINLSSIAEIWHEKRIAETQ